MNVVVTGATSFIGVPMVNELITRGYHVFAVVRPRSENISRLNSNSEKLHIVEMELGELDRIGEKIPVSCTYFYHFGWDGAGSENRMNREVQQKNVVDSLKALEGAKSLNCRRFLFSGSQAEYGLHQEAMTEDTLCVPISEYGKAKTEFCQKAQSRIEDWKEAGLCHMEYIHTRIFSIYGPGDHPWSLIESCVKTFLKGDYLSLGECSQMWNFLHIDDLIRALTLLMEQETKETCGVYNIAGSNTETRILRDYVRKIYEICGLHGSFSYGRRDQNAEGPANLIPDITKLERAVNWKQEVTFEEGIKRLVRSFKI